MNQLFEKLDTGTFDPLLETCLLCGCSHIFPYHEDQSGRQVHRCAHCGVQFMNPPYSDTYLQEYYSKYIVEEPEVDAARSFQHEHHLDLILKHFGRQGRLLDIGCGQGHLLRSARQQGWQVKGFDVDPKTVASISARHGLEIHSGEFLETPFEAESQDVVTMHQVLEHLKDPLPIVGRIRDILCPGGLLFIAVPNIEGFSSGIKYSLEKMGLRRRNRGSYYDMDHHLFFYSPETLERFLVRLGFRVLHTSSTLRAKQDEPAWLPKMRKHTIDRWLPRSSFLVLARKR